MQTEDIKFFEGLTVGAVLMGLVVLAFFAYGLFRQTVHETEMNYVVAKTIISPAISISHENLAEQGQVIKVGEDLYSIRLAIKHFDNDIVFRTLQSESGQFYASLWGQGGQELLTMSTLGIRDDLTFQDFYSGREVIVSLPTGDRYLLDIESTRLTDYPR